MSIPFPKNFLSVIDKLHKAWYNIYAPAPDVPSTLSKSRHRKEGSEMDVFSFVMSVLASVIANYISKLMDKHN